MKVRIKGDSIRYRLTQSDLENFFKNKYIEEITNFPQNQLVYALKAISCQEIYCEFENNKITIFFPENELELWYKSNQVGYQNIQGFNNIELKILVEKDFVCLDNSEEDQSDNFPNPNAIC
jgi:hypothetical protein